MNRYHFLTEAELDTTQKSLLSQLSDEDLEAIVSELGEAEGGRFAYDPLKRSAPAQQPKPQQPQQPKPQQPKPQPKQQPKPQPKAEPARKAEIKKTVSELKPKEKSALVKAAKAELKQRETKPKEVKPAQPGTLKKVVRNLALAAVAATVIGGMFGGGDNATSGADSSASVQQVQQDSKYLTRVGDKGKYKIVSTRTWEDNPNVTITLSSRLNADSTTSYTVRGIDSKNNLVYELPSGVTNTSDDLSKMKSIFNSSIKFDKPTDIGRGTIQAMLRDALPTNAVLTKVAPGNIMTGEDFMNIAKRMTLPGMPDPANDPNTENFARIIDSDNGKYFNIPKPARGEEAEIFQSIMLSAMADATTIQKDPSVNKDEFLKNPLRTTLRYSLGKRYPVEK